MTETVLMGVLVVVILLLVAFIGYYAFRLVKAGKAAEGTAQRFQLFMQRQNRLQQEVQSVSTPETWAGPGLPAAPEGPPVEPGTVRAFERVLNLSVLSSDPIFVRRAKEGAILVQWGEKPSMPLAYVLDPAARRKLNEVVGQATTEFGLVWSILAQDGADGKLTITRLV
jgi:hypothetical protein